MRMLELTLRLQEMTQVATALRASGELDSEAAHELDAELTKIEAEVQGADDKVMRDLLSVVSVVRGLLYKFGEGFSDEEVEGLPRASFTYASPRYWDDYYNKTTEEERFDWYGTWDTAIEEASLLELSTRQAEPDGKGEAQQLGDLLRPYLSPESKILMLGCGNSDMSEKMYQQGFQSIVNVDISERLLENLRARLGASMPRMSWQLANASALSFEDEVFDVILDKGTFDALEANMPLVQAAMREVHRTLRPGGFLLSVTFNDVSTRVEAQLQQAADWATCRTRAFDRLVRKGNEAEKSRYYMHACGRRA